MQKNYRQIYFFYRQFEKFSRNWFPIVLNGKQFRFGKHRSAVDAMATLVQSNRMTTLLKSKTTVSTLLYLQKAFDAVDRNIFFAINVGIR